MTEENPKRRILSARELTLTQLREEIAWAINPQSGNDKMRLATLDDIGAEHLNKRKRALDWLEGKVYPDDDPTIKKMQKSDVEEYVRGLMQKHTNHPETLRGLSNLVNEIVGLPQY
ncbi:MAG: hypothetical protein M1120_02160 [Patescibacteria group bacterium]|nr:hypothetical protein [Patescibacteria group bacterium]